MTNKSEISKELYLIFDTETTGVPKNYKAPVSDLNNWPRMVQLAWILSTGQETVSHACQIIKPHGFSIPDQAVQVHGITNERAQKEGQEISLVLKEFLTAMNQASVLVAHNMQFDEKILGAELLRNGHANLLEQKKKICTMLSSKKFYGLKNKFGYKWPTLQELHYKLFDAEFDDAHDACSDAQACARCFFELRKRRIISG